MQLPASALSELTCSASQGASRHVPRVQNALTCHVIAEISQLAMAQLNWEEKTEKDAKYLVLGHLLALDNFHRDNPSGQIPLDNLPLNNAKLKQFLISLVRKFV